MTDNEHRRVNIHAAHHAMRLAWVTSGRTLHHLEMALWHFAHGLIRTRWTAHETWGRKATLPPEGLRGL